MLIAEALVLLSLTPEGRTARRGSEEAVSIGAAGALVAELALGGWSVVEGRRLTAPSEPPPADPLLARADRECWTLVGTPLWSALTAMRKVVGRSAVLDRLEAQGIVGRERDGRFAPTRHPVLRPGQHAEVLARVRHDAGGDHLLAPSAAVLLALTGGAQQLQVVVPSRRDRGPAKRRMREALGRADAPAEVLAALAAVEGAVSHAVTAASAPD